MSLWFAFSAFADAAALYEQVVRTSGNVPGLAAAGAALVDSARNVDEAMAGIEDPGPHATVLGRRAPGDADSRPAVRGPVGSEFLGHVHGLR